MTTLTVSANAAPGLKVDALVVGIAKGTKGPVVVEATDVAGAIPRLAVTLSALGATGAAGEVTKLVPAGSLSAPLLLAVGLGDERIARRGERTPYDAEVLRRAAGAAVRALAGTNRVALALPAETPEEAAAVAEGALLGAYAFLRYRTTSRADHKDPVATLTLRSGAAKDKAVKAAVDRARTVAAAVNLTRDLVNTPAVDLPPIALAAAATEAARGRSLDVQVLDEKALRKGGYGGIVGVGQGSANPPRLVKITYRGRGAKRHLALVGKGITFDSGGLSLKPPAGMETMKSDMGGAAAVIAAMTAIADLGLAVDVTGWAPIAENMPSGSAQRPSDVITIFGGKTVEVLNTDAEGRLVLADALVAASAETPDVIVDAATLTGAQLVALGARTSAIMSNDDELQTRIHALTQEVGEAMWPMPLPEELRKSLDSTVADIANMGDRFGGMLVAGLFLKDFVGEGIRWAHLDIAGPAFNDRDPYGYTPKGGTGAAVRTFVRLAEAMAAGEL